jgi:hypothetical protein
MVGRRAMPVPLARQGVDPVDQAELDNQDTAKNN